MLVVRYSIMDRLIMHCDQALRGKRNVSKTTNPASRFQNDCLLSPESKRKTIAMMRVNHSGEVCAQALYYGQALFARSSSQYQNLMRAAAEENDHLIWCKARLKDLEGRTSLLNPFWFIGSFGIGALAASHSDPISLGFVAETEHQVSAHIDRHLAQLDPRDDKTKAVLLQMRIDETQHATNAERAGAQQLPWYIKFLMSAAGKIMTATASRI